MSRVNWLRCIVLPLVTMVVAAGLVTECRGEDVKKSVGKEKIDPAALKLYGEMRSAIKNAESLSFSCKYDRAATGIFKSECTYKVWLRKPNYFRMEAQSPDGKQQGVLIGDGGNLWIHWPTGRPKWQYVKDSAEDEKSRFSSYMTKAAPRGKHSIWHEARYLGAGMSYPIIDVSLFHEHIDSIEPYLDAAKGLGQERINGEECSVIDVRFMDGQRNWKLWLSKKDHLPRKLSEVVKVTYDVVTEEVWSDVVVNAPIPDSMFSWKPPANWKEWSLPSDESGLVKIGADAPDFTLTSSEGKPIKLSQFRGKPVWLCFWRVGCPPCREEMPLLEKIHRHYKEKGLVMLAVNVSDERKIALKFLRDHGITFSNIIDTSSTAEKICSAHYGGGTVPMNYIVSAEGKVLDAWFGLEEFSKRQSSSLKKLGLEK